MRLAATALALTVAGTGCHTYARYDDTVAGDTRERKREGAARVLEPTIEVTRGGMLRFAEPMVCTYDVVVEQSNYRVTRTQPNMATFIVGLITMSAGAVALISGLSDSEPGSAPATYLGVGGLAVGLPFAVGPFLGNGRERVHTGDGETVQGTKDLACGSRPVAATTALVRSGKRQLFGGVKDGVFAVSPFTFVDAFALHKLSGLELSAELFDDAGDRRTMNVTLDAAALARGRDGFFAGLGIDGTVEPLQKVPRVIATDLVVTRVLADGQPAIEVSVRVENRGPGTAHGVRGSLSSSNPQLDGRMLYVGRLAAGATANPRALVLMRADAAALGDARIAVTLYDAHATTSDVPLEFRGAVLNRR